MNNNNDIDNHRSTDSVNESHAFADEQQPSLPNEKFPADGEYSEEEALNAGGYEAAEYPTDRLKCLDPDMQPPTEAGEDSGDSATISAQEDDQPHGEIWAPEHEGRADRVAALVTALASKQLELAHQEQENVELNSQINDQSAHLAELKASRSTEKSDVFSDEEIARFDEEIARLNFETPELRKLVRRLEDRVDQGAEKNAKLRARLDGGEDYLQALNAQSGKLDSMLDTLSQTHTWVSELNSALSEDLNACNELASNMQAHEGQLAELEALVDRVCSASPSGNEIRQHAAEAEPMSVETLETLHEVDAVNRLLITMNGDHVIKYPLYKSIVTIGRERFNDIQIRTQYVSRSHARIVTDNSGAIIEDMNSKNGITVNGRSVQLRQLKNGDLVEVGKIHFKFIDLMADDAGEGTA